MSVTIRDFPARGVITVQVQGMFDLTQLPAFEQLLLDASESRAKYIIDLTATDQVRDSGIAILLMLVKQVGPARLEVLNCSADLQRRLVGALGPVQSCAVH